MLQAVTDFDYPQITDYPRSSASNRRSSAFLRKTPHLNCLPSTVSVGFLHETHNLQCTNFQFSMNAVRVFENCKLRIENSEFCGVPNWLDVKVLKMAVSLSDPRLPRETLQILATTLRIKTLKSIPSCSKASGVFSSRCRYPASSRESHFHRAHR